MAKKSSYLIGGLALTAMMIGALPAAQGIGASTQEAPVLQINRSAKGDRLVEPKAVEQGSIAAKKAPVQTPRENNPVREQTDKRQIMDGCEPVFSSVTVPTMAHIAGRCVG